MFRTLILSLTIALLASGQTKQERKFLIKHLNDSYKTFQKSVKGLSEAQWKFKAAPEKWSIAECAEHLATSESFIFGMATTDILKAPAPLKRLTEAEDQTLLKRMTDRSQRANAPEPLKPSGKYATPDEAVSALREARKKSVAWVKANREDLRAHFSDRVKMDAYQAFLMMSAHVLRHTDQIEEVKRASGYPAQ
jgi:hypothetical protein